MPTLKFSKIAFALLVCAAVAIGTHTALGFFAEEKLYPVENVPTLELPIIFASEPPQAANRFIPDLPKTTTVQRPLSDVKNLAAKFDARNLKIELLASEPIVGATEVESCKSLVESTLAALPADLTSSLEEMKLIFAKRNPRGLANSRLIELRCGEISDDEVVAVLVHELGHIVDLGKLKGDSLAPSEFVDGKIPVPANDPSVTFYQLSWRNESEKNYLADRKDFVSGYAMTDPFEDFSESFNFYVLHGADFRAVKNESSILTAKYDFLKNKVFAGIEFESKRATKPGKRVWDATLVEFDRAEFFARG
ncbi:MAG: hypothetical protein WCV72_02140 [Patescibacteria group bacterium]